MADLNENKSESESKKEKESKKDKHPIDNSWKQKFLKIYSEECLTKDATSQKLCQIAKKAGYHNWKIFHLSNYPELQTEIEKINKSRDLELASAGITKAKIISELFKIAKADIRKLVKENGDIKSLSEIEDDYLAMSISEISFYQNGKIKSIKLLDKLKSFELISKHLGLLVERIEVKDSMAEAIYKARERLEKAKPIIIEADADKIQEEYQMINGYRANGEVKPKAISDITEELKDKEK